jgi:hypothetical protein
MQVAARIETIEIQENRGTPRRRANQMASLRQRKLPPEMIQLIDISPSGAGFRSRWPFTVGNRVWLSLPGLETWPATIAWYEEGRGGLRFDSPLHPVVAERYASDIGRAG